MSNQEEITHPRRTFGSLDEAVAGGSVEVSESGSFNVKEECAIRGSFTTMILHAGDNQSITIE